MFYSFHDVFINVCKCCSPQFNISFDICFCLKLYSFRILTTSIQSYLKNRTKTPRPTNV